MLAVLIGVFANSAPPQKVLFTALLLLSVFFALVMALRPLQKVTGLGPLIDALSMVCPMLGVLCASLNGLHMMQTTVRLPFDVTGKMLAPGLMEMAALVAAGTIAGLLAKIAQGSLASKSPGAGRQT